MWKKELEREAGGGGERNGGSGEEEEGEAKMGEHGGEGKGSGGLGRAGRHREFGALSPRGNLGCDMDRSREEGPLTPVPRAHSLCRAPCARTVWALKQVRFHRK